MDFFNFDHCQVWNFEISNLFECYWNSVVTFQKYQKQNRKSTKHIAIEWKQSIITLKFCEISSYSWNLINYWGSGFSSKRQFIKTPFHQSSYSSNLHIKVPFIEGSFHWKGAFSSLAPFDEWYLLCRFDEKPPPMGIKWKGTGRRFIEYVSEVAINIQWTAPFV
jgi:hypothetical protein